MDKSCSASHYLPYRTYRAYTSARVRALSENKMSRQATCSYRCFLPLYAVVRGALELAVCMLLHHNIQQQRICEAERSSSAPASVFLHSSVASGEIILLTREQQHVVCRIGSARQKLFRSQRSSSSCALALRAVEQPNGVLYSAGTRWAHGGEELSKANRIDGRHISRLWRPLVGRHLWLVARLERAICLPGLAAPAPASKKKKKAKELHPPIK